MSKVFRKSALDKLSSPEQLDRMIVIVSPSFWLFLAGAALIIVTALLWSIFGRLPINVDTQGIYINEEGVRTIYSEGSGIVKEVYFDDGEAVKVGDVIFTLDTTEIDKQIADYERRIKNVEGMTLYSQNDIYSSDTQNLIEVKNQLLTVDQNLNQNQSLLNYYSAELSEMRGKEASSQKAYLNAESAYYDSLYYGENTSEQLAYSEAQSTLSSVLEVYSSVYDEWAVLNEQYESQVTEEMKDEEKQALKDSLGLTEAEENLAYYEEEKTSATVAYESAKAAYQNKTASMNNAQQVQTQLGNEYNEAANQYNTDKQQLMTLEDQVAQYRIQVQEGEKNLGTQKQIISKQFESAKASVLDQLENEYDQCLQQKENAEVKATEDGTISNLSVTKGSAVAEGSEVVQIQMGQSAERVIVCYVPVASGRKIEEGMSVMIYPSTVDRQEYGHMEATVVSVDAYVTSTEKMQRQLGNANLVESFMQEGPVIEVICELRTSDETESGYFWSSKKGANIMINAGTMVEASIVTEEKAPISMLIPYLKNKLTVKAVD